MSGFTLIELILTMALIAILSVIGIGSYTQATLKSRDTQRKNDLNQMAKAIELFNNDLGRYPSIDESGEMLCPGIDGNEIACNTSIYAYNNNEVTAKAVYMDKIPVDPSSTRDYVYVPDDPGVGGFALYAALENTEDKDVVKDADQNVTTWDQMCGEVNCNYKLTDTGLLRTK